MIEKLDSDGASIMRVHGQIAEQLKGLSLAERETILAILLAETRAEMRALLPPDHEKNIETFMGSIKLPAGMRKDSFIRYAKYLKHVGVHAVHDMQAYTVAELQVMIGFNAARLAVLKAALDTIGFQLEEFVPREFPIANRSVACLPRLYAEDLSSAVGWFLWENNETSIGEMASYTQSELIGLLEKHFHRTRSKSSLATQNLNKVDEYYHELRALFTRILPPQ